MEETEFVPAAAVEPELGEGVCRGRVEGHVDTLRLSLVEESLVIQQPAANVELLVQGRELLVLSACREDFKVATT